MNNTSSITLEEIENLAEKLVNSMTIDELRDIVYEQLVDSYVQDDDLYFYDLDSVKH